MDTSAQVMMFPLMLFTVIHEIIVICIIVSLKAILVKTLLLIALVSLCYSLVRRIQMDTHITCTWCGSGISVNSKKTVFLRITGFEYYFDEADCLVKWLYSRSIIKLEAGERIPGIPLIPQEDG